MQPESQNQSVHWGGNADVAVSQNKVLRNTYMLLAVSLVPTIFGALVGSQINLGFLRTSPIISALAVMAIFYGWIFMIEKNKNSSVGLYLLLGFTFFMGLLLTPLLQRTLGLANGGQLVMMAAANPHSNRRCLCHHPRVKTMLAIQIGAM